jgi:hypothetical protein
MSPIGTLEISRDVRSAVAIERKQTFSDIDCRRPCNIYQIGPQAEGRYLLLTMRGETNPSFAQPSNDRAPFRLRAFDPGWLLSDPSEAQPSEGWGRPPAARLLNELQSARETAASALRRAIFICAAFSQHLGNQSSAQTAVSMINQKSPSREGELTPMRRGKTVGSLALGVNKENVHGDREISDDAEFSARCIGALR